MSSKKQIRLIRYGKKLRIFTKLVESEEITRTVKREAPSKRQAFRQGRMSQISKSAK
jgi:hypothetical protein